MGTKLYMWRFFNFEQGEETHIRVFDHIKISLENRNKIAQKQHI